MIKSSILLYQTLQWLLYYAEGCTSIKIVTVSLDEKIRGKKKRQLDLVSERRQTSTSDCNSNENISGFCGSQFSRDEAELTPCELFPANQRTDFVHNLINSIKLVHTLIYTHGKSSSTYDSISPIRDLYYVSTSFRPLRCHDWESFGSNFMFIFVYVLIQCSMKYEI